jgi:cyclic pyranopterin phosphate synthase
MKGVNENETLDLIMLSEKLPVHIRFIEYMPFSGTSWNKEQVYDIKNIIEEMSNTFDIEKLVDDKNDTAKKYKVKNFKGTFSIITTMTDPFCETCNRLRLTADGKMKNCLFAEDETDLLTPLREGKNISDLIFKNVMQKHWQQGGQEINEHTHNRNMMTIGG